MTTGPEAHARKFYRLQGGKPGSLQTAAIMANLVREDAVKNKQLELFAAQLLVNNRLDSHSDPTEIADAIFRYVQTFTYVHDPAGAFDSVQSASQVIREGKGDCDDLSVLLATLLALVGFKPRFVLARYKETSEGFDHVYVDLELAQGRLVLDPSTRTHGVGWESPKAIERIAYPIFDGKVIGLGEIAQRVKRIFTGFGCEENCKSQVNEIRTVGSDIVSASGGVSLSLPAVLFGVGVVVVALKLTNYLDARY